MSKPLNLIKSLAVFWAASLVSANAQDLSFTRKEITLDAPLAAAGEALRIFATDSDALISVTRDSEANHKLHLFASDSFQSSRPVPTKTIDVPKNAIFYALGEMPEGEREKLLVFTETGISAYDPETNTFAPLVNTKSLFRQGTDLRFQRAGFARDVNDDDRFDLIVQDFDGLKVFYQLATGAFSDPTLIPVEPELRLTGVYSNDNISDTALTAPVTRTPTFNIFPSYISDATGDGRSDISFLVGRSFQIFAQMPDGTHSTMPLTSEFPFEVRGNRWRDEVLSQEQNSDQSKFREVTIYRILDLDSDGTLDIVTVENLASGALDRNQVLNVYSGRYVTGKLSYKASQDARIEINGIGGAGFRDVNNDGLSDIVTTSANISIGKIISFLINRRISMRTSFFLNDRQSTFSEDRDYRRNRSISFDLSKGQTLSPPFDYADFNGDGTLDLMDADRDGSLKLLAGGAEENFTRELAELRDTFPNEGWLVTAEDINNDGKADIIIRYNQFGLDGSEMSNRLVLHLSQ